MNGMTRNLFFLSVEKTIFSKKETKFVGIGGRCTLYVPAKAFNYIAAGGFDCRPYSAVATTAEEKKNRFKSIFLTTLYKNNNAGEIR